jgi:hypothetical protein
MLLVAMLSRRGGNGGGGRYSVAPPPPAIRSDLPPSRAVGEPLLYFADDTGECKELRR